jgi:broad specificity phosphatase PhoE
MASSEEVLDGLIRGSASDGQPSGGSGAAVVRIYLVRHGRTALNAAGALRGHLDPELDEWGLQQVSVVGDVLGRLSLQLTVSSPLRRAIETAKAVASRAAISVEIDERFIDRDYGAWAGHNPDDLIARFGSVDAAPGVEPATVVLGRARNGLEHLADSVGDGSGVVVSHDVVNRLLLHAIDESLGEVDQIPQDTACFNVLERRDGAWSVASVNNAPAGHDPGPVAPDRPAHPEKTAVDVAETAKGD